MPSSSSLGLIDSLIREPPKSPGVPAKRDHTGDARAWRQGGRWRPLAASTRALRGQVILLTAMIWPAMSMTSSGRSRAIHSSNHRAG
jgi:hypothetical protein